MNDLNKVIITGRLTREPELKQTSNGVSIVTESLAVNGPKDKSGEEQTYFFDITAFRGTAELLARICNKGDKITVVGSLEQTRYKNSKGEDRQSVKILFNEFHLTGKALQAAGQAERAQDNEPVFENVGESEDLPF